MMLSARFENLDEYIEWFNKSDDPNYQMRKHRFGIYLWTIEPEENWVEWETYVRAVLDNLELMGYKIGVYTCYYKKDYRKSAVIPCKLVVKSSLTEGGL